MKTPLTPLLMVVAAALLIGACESPTAVETADPAVVALSAGKVGPKPGKQGVCHLGDTGAYEKITIAQPAVEAHLRHGDTLAGGDTLDENCQPYPPPAVCPCLVALAEPISVVVNFREPLFVNGPTVSDNGLGSVSFWYSFVDGSGDNYLIDLQLFGSDDGTSGNYCRGSVSIDDPQGPPFDGEYYEVGPGLITSEHVSACQQGLRDLYEQLQPAADPGAGG